MLQVDIKVNSEIIGQIEIVNRGPASPHLIDEDICWYEWRFSNISGNKVTKGTIFHNRKDGFERLVAQVLDQYLGDADMEKVRQLNRICKYENTF